MPRVSKKVSQIAVIEPVKVNPDEYADFTSALIRYGLLIRAKRNNDTKLLESPDGVYDVSNNIDLTAQQVKYLNMKISGLTASKICKTLNIDMASALLWEEEGGKNSLFNCCMEAIKTIQARNAEDALWDTIERNPESCKGNLIMYATKARLPEYRENAPMVNIMSKVSINIEGQPYKVVADTNVIEGEFDEVQR
jgi:hypothetical protein